MNIEYYKGIIIYTDGDVIDHGFAERLTFDKACDDALEMKKELYAGVSDAYACVRKVYEDWSWDDVEIGK